MKLFVVTRYGSCCMEVEIVRGETAECVPALPGLDSEHFSPFDRQTIEELSLEGPEKTVFSACYIE
jgi:hypothetical protein